MEEALGEYRIGSLLRQLNSSLIQYKAGETRLSDITPTQCILLHILLQEGREGICSSDICAESGLSRASISGILKLLRRKGYLTMESLPEDERRKKIVLTEKVYTVRNEIEEEIKNQLKCMCRGISEEELRLVEDVLQRMIHNLRNNTKSEGDRN